jgi:hypothetical protein
LRAQIFATISWMSVFPAAARTTRHPQLYFGQTRSETLSLPLAALGNSVFGCVCRRADTPLLTAYNLRFDFRR